MTGQTPAAFRCLIVGLPPRDSPAVEPAPRVSVAALPLSTALTAPLHRLLNLALSPAPPFPSPAPGRTEEPSCAGPLCHLGAALATLEALHPVTAKQERAFGEGEGIPLLCLFLVFVFSQPA